MPEIISDEKVGSALRSTAMTICGLYGTLILLIGASLGMYDIGKGGVNGTSFIFIPPAFALLYGFFGAYFRHKYWPLAPLAGSIWILAVVYQANNESNRIIHFTPITVVGLLTPVALIFISLAALKYRSNAPQKN